MRACSAEQEGGRGQPLVVAEVVEEHGFLALEGGVHEAPGQQDGLVAFRSAGSHGVESGPAVLEEDRGPPGLQQGPQAVQEVGEQLLGRAVLQQLQGKGLDLADHLAQPQGLRGLAAALRGGAEAVQGQHDGPGRGGCIGVCADANLGPMRQRPQPDGHLAQADLVLLLQGMRNRDAFAVEGGAIQGAQVLEVGNPVL